MRDASFFIGNMAEKSAKLTFCAKNRQVFIGQEDIPGMTESKVPARNR